MLANSSIDYSKVKGSFYLPEFENTKYRATFEYVNAADFPALNLIAHAEVMGGMGKWHHHARASVEAGKYDC